MRDVFDFLTETIVAENFEHEMLENVSSEYYNAVQQAETYYEQIKENLPPEMRYTLLRLDDERNRMEATGKDVNYRKGFCDAVRLIMQTLVWEPRRS